jgi:hypothetical protein
MEFNKKPITRLDVLQKAKKNKHLFSGLCSAIMETAGSFIKGCDYEEEGHPYDGFVICNSPDIIPNKLIPKFTHENAKQFNAVDMPFWWKYGDWDTGRMDFLNWLIEQYKDDTEDVTPIIEVNYLVLDELYPKRTF